MKNTRPRSAHCDAGPARRVAVGIGLAAVALLSPLALVTSTALAPSASAGLPTGDTTPKPYAPLSQKPKPYKKLTSKPKPKSNGGSSSGTSSGSGWGSSSGSYDSSTSTPSPTSASSTTIKKPSTSTSRKPGEQKGAGTKTVAPAPTPTLAPIPSATPQPTTTASPVLTPSDPEINDPAAGGSSAGKLKIVAYVVAGLVAAWVMGFVLYLTRLRMQRASAAARRYDYEADEPVAAG